LSRLMSKPRNFSSLKEGAANTVELEKMIN
jgi:hypothetical protein